ncbi:MAG TPA: AAA family ATPase [Leptospiraceae bacterium]|nr:AAA family ATPase [Leptospiraceae bacterium]HMX33718.1 AAA family ATPase [Leptospiraceae bacterium]HMY32903.1 AAA family ATPase [Leptospiraceae bacterium]HMZ66635.1 AAA family ATPase [Leptospiraceae bacterium]HNA09013.1 AAA family ATPase [Leptospiraceae bacterium]
MYLKSMNIVGFKTFADETDVVFDPGFTAVVGPNGSGKSNIVDALRWVLGEKSAKGLRGDKMEDVIFHGSETRDPAGFAEVAVNIDNTSKTLPIDFPTVKITRRLFPDLTNEYYINNSRVLRKDVEKLLMDTGIGKASYSIMEQGRVEAILNAKPEDRRAIFDEAAGISKFKLDRLETEKKLELTTQNLLRITDIMSSMEKELELKSKQAERAKAYFDLKNKVTEADKNLRYLKLKSLKSRSKKVDAELTEVKRKNEELMARMSDDAKLIEEREKFRYEMEQKIAEIDKKLLDFLSQKEIQREKIEKNKSIIHEFDQRIDELTTNLESEKTRMENAEAEYNQLLALSDNLAKMIQMTLENVERFTSDKKQLEINIEEELKNIQSYQDSIASNDKKHNVLREKLKDSILSLINQIEEKKRDAEKFEGRREELRKYLILSLDESIEKINEILSSELNSERITQILKELNLTSYRENLKDFIEMEDVFRDILLDKDGLLAKKESIDSEIEDLILENENLSRKIKDANSNIESLRYALEEKKEEIVKLEKSILEMEGKTASALDARDKELRIKHEAGDRIANFEKSIEALQTKKVTYQEEVKLLEEQIEKSYTEFLGMSKTLEAEKEQLKELFSEIQNLKSSSQADQEEFKSIIPVMNDLERKASALRVQLDTFNEELYNDYSMSDVELEEEKSSLSLKQEAEDSRLRELKSEMQLLGSINPLAVEEYNNVKEIYDHHKNQKEDIEKSKQDILDVLKNINSESEKLFIETFEVIKKNFQETFSTLFNGGHATIELTEKEDRLNSGVEIIAEPPGKHVQNLKLLSGGEKSMTVIALLFAIYMVKPSPFCFLDEIDAALDEVNKIRFCQILDKFKDVSQFVVITHAPPTISRANAIFGVTSAEPGVSKVVSLKIEEAKQFAKKFQEAV